MPGRPTRRLVSLLLVATVAAGACAAAAPSGSPAGATVVPATTPTGSAPPAPSVPAAGRTASPGPSLSAEPPPATLKAEGGDPVAGQLGSYTWNGGGSDSPWLQGAPIRVGAGEPLTVTIGGGPAVGDWSVQRVAGGSTGASGTEPMGSGEGTPVAFLAPGAGAWSILVDVRFADGSDAAAYYWLLDVR